MPVWDRRKLREFCMEMDQQARSVKTIPLQSGRSMPLSAMMLSVSDFYLFICLLIYSNISGHMVIIGSFHMIAISRNDI